MRRRLPLVAVVGLGLAGVVLVAAGWAVLAVLVVAVVAPLVWFGRMAARNQPERRYDAVGYDVAAMIERVGSAPRVRRRRDPGRGEGEPPR